MVELIIVAMIFVITLISFLAPVFLVGAVVVMGISATKNFQGSNEAWRQAAKRLGLSVNEGGLFSRPSMEGTLRGIDVAAESKRIRYGSHHSRHYEDRTVFRARLSYPWTGRIQLTRRGFMDKVGEMFGGQDIPTGYEDFDEELRVRGVMSPEIARSLSRPELRRRLRLIASDYHAFRVEDGELSIQVKYHLSNADELVRHLENVASSAALLNGAEPETEEVEQRLEMEGDDELLFPDLDRRFHGDEDRSDSSQDRAGSYSNISW